MNETFNVPMINAANADLRAMIRELLDAWAKHCPGEVRAAKAYLEDHKQHQADRTGRTGLGEHVLGAIPGKIATGMAMILQDPHWMHNNPEALSIVFQEFEIGRFARWEGTGREGAGAHNLTLNAADK